MVTTIVISERAALAIAVIDSEVESEGGEEVPAAIARTQQSRKGKGRKRKRSSSVADQQEEYTRIDSDAERAHLFRDQ